jgi:hypothetical protein
MMTTPPRPVLPVVYQRPHDLALIVSAGELRPPTPLRILAQETALCGAWRFTFHVIGESHWVQVAQGSTPILQEVLACIPFDPAACLHHHRFADLGAHGFRRDAYQVQVRMGLAGVDWQPQGTLRVEFPAIYGQRPFTYLQWRQVAPVEVRGQAAPATVPRMEWYTLHTYPTLDGVHHVESISAFSVHFGS